jgi:hypothetical protein
MKLITLLFLVLFLTACATSSTGTSVDDVFGQPGGKLKMPSEKMEDLKDKIEEETGKKIKKPTNILPEPEYDCEANEDLFDNFSELHEDVDFIVWCEMCVLDDGVPTPELSQFGGPFCNPKTSDGGAECTDSDECEGFCVAEDMTVISGQCSDYKEMESGCFPEMVLGEPALLCVN